MMGFSGRHCGLRLPSVARNDGLFFGASPSLLAASSSAVPLGAAKRPNAEEADYFSAEARIGAPSASGVQQPAM